MIFQSYEFLLFFAVTLAVCLPAARRSVPAAKALLTLASLLFYLWGFEENALLGFVVLLAGSWVSFSAGRYLTARRQRDGSAKAVFALALIWHIAVLVAFKYTGFLTGGAVSVPFVPLGLSFFTFQQLWYLKEIWTGQFVPSRWSLSAGVDFTLFSFFFPTVSSGPILRPGAFFPQLSDGRFLHPTWTDAAAGLYAIVLGCAKKILLADSFGILVGNGYTHLTELDTISASMVVLGYTLQLYFDFSGYCDMAAGLARLLGIRLPVNFDSPYRSLSVGEFWKRWHITLTTFLRECLYFPLGGSKKGTARTYCNILIIYLVSGLWHGAGWTFLLWGALHGLAQVAERLLGQRRDKLPKWLQWVLTFAFVNVAWVYFRAPSVAEGTAVLRAVFSLRFSKPQAWLSEGIFSSELEAVRILLPALAPWRNVLAVAALFLVAMVIALWPRNTIRQMDRFKPTFWRGAALFVLAMWSVLSFSGITQFIYSNF